MFTINSKKYCKLIELHFESLGAREGSNTFSSHSRWALAEMSGFSIVRIFLLVFLVHSDPLNVFALKIFFSKKRRSKKLPIIYFLSQTDRRRLDRSLTFVVDLAMNSYHFSWCISYSVNTHLSIYRALSSATESNIVV